MVGTICLISALVLLVFKAEAGAEVLQFPSGESDSDREVYIQKSWTSFKTRYGTYAATVTSRTFGRQLSSVNVNLGPTYEVYRALGSKNLDRHY